MAPSRFFFKRSARAIGAAALFSLFACGAVNAGSASYKYDSLGRLSEAAYASGVVIRYSYDSAGNRVTETTAGVRLTLQAQAAIMVIITELLLD